MGFTAVSPNLCPDPMDRCDSGKRRYNRLTSKAVINVWVYDGRQALLILTNV